MVYPPSTRMLCPVMKRAPSLASHTATSPICSGCPHTFHRDVLDKGPIGDSTTAASIAGSFRATVYSAGSSCRTVAC